MTSTEFLGILKLQIQEIHADVRVIDLIGKEAFVKVELANSDGLSIKKRSKTVASNGPVVIFYDQMSFDVNDSNTELLIKLCVKKSRMKPAVVVSGGGIFIKDIVGARKYEKWFKLFTPSGSVDGGYIRLVLDFERVVPPGSMIAPPTSQYNEMPNSPQMNPSAAINLAPSSPSPPTSPRSQVPVQFDYPPPVQSDFGGNSARTPRGPADEYFRPAGGKSVHYSTQPRVNVAPYGQYNGGKGYGKRRQNPLGAFLKFVVGLGAVGYAAGCLVEMQRKQARRQRRWASEKVWG